MKLKLQIRLQFWLWALALFVNYSNIILELPKDDLLNFLNAINELDDPGCIIVD